MDSKQTYCVGGCLNCNRIDITKYEKVNHKTQNVAEVRKGKCDICGRNKSQLFTN